MPKAPYPKSLSNQWVQGNQTALFLKDKNTIEDRLNTAVELTAILISEAIEDVIRKENYKKDNYKLLATGGGAYNTYLMKRIRVHLEKNNIEIITPGNNMIGFKEAALMALLGVMRIEKIPNCMASVTGAERDSIGGAVYHP